MAGVGRLLALAGLLVTGGCRTTPAPHRPTAAEVRTHYYSNDRGVTVTTVGADVAQALTDNLMVTAHGLTDRVVVQRPKNVVIETGNQDTGHVHDDVDAVTSASVTVTGGDRLEKNRYEGSLGALYTLRLHDAPTQVRGRVLYSSEPDYRAMSGRLGAQTELFNRNTTVAAFLGFGRDTLDPLVPPPGEQDLWPAVHARITGGLSLNQLLSPRLEVAVGLAGSHQFGQLSSPYRRARVRTSLFPERLPSVRNRLTAYSAASWFLGWSSALHLRAGAYLDDWGIRAAIPEVGVSRELGARVVVSVRHRLYLQGAAFFHQPAYDELLPLRSGDVRLARIIDHSPSAEVQWFPWGVPGDARLARLVAGYRLSVAQYGTSHEWVVSHVGSLGLTGGF